MSITAAIFYPELKRLVGDTDSLQLSGTTVGEALAELGSRFPGAEGLLFNGRGDLQKAVHVFVNREGMRKTEMNRRLEDGDRLIIAVLASGG